MILQSLNAYYQRLLDSGEKDLAPFGYSPEKISYEIVLRTDGSVAAVNNICDTSGKKPQAKILNVPQPNVRPGAPDPNFLWDKTSYVLGVSLTSQRSDKEHAAFKNRHLEALAQTQDVGLTAFVQFLNAWLPAHADLAPFTQDMLDTNLVFRLDGELLCLHDRPSAQAIRAQLWGVKNESPQSTSRCLVSNEESTPARIHHRIKGVKDAQSSGACIVGFNLDAFTSYGKIQGENAPVSEHATFSYTTALNHLLRRSEHNRQRLQIGDATVVFWAQAPQSEQAKAAEFCFMQMLNPPPEDAPEAEKLRQVLLHVQRGRALHEIDPQLHPETRIFVLGLAANAARLSIRFWQTDRLDVFAQRLSAHAQDMALVPQPWKTAPAVFRLVLATVAYRGQGSKPSAEDAPPQLIGQLMQAILNGTPYPRSLLATLLMRMRSDGHISGIRVALCKAILAREQRLGLYRHEQELPVSLDPNSTHPGYRLGRLFAVLENIQRTALGKDLNATIRDRYYGAASATPATVFPMLLRNTQNHLSKIRKDKIGLAIKLEGQITAIVEGLSEQLPSSLRMQDQGRFALGYYHQHHQTYAGKTAAPAEADTDTDLDTEDTPDHGENP
jgi:CRISPR-associated protein Csd1